MKKKHTIKKPDTQESIQIWKDEVSEWVRVAVI
jgi:hypothetical protein